VGVGKGRGECRIHPHRTGDTVICHRAVGEILAAYAKLLTLLATEEYSELPQQSATGLVPLNSETVRVVAVWESI
jgi:hypothetical protein